MLLPELVEMLALPPFTDYNGANALLKLVQSKKSAAQEAASDGATAAAPQESNVAPPTSPLEVTAKHA